MLDTQSLKKLQK